MKAPRKAGSGFSLLELVLVLAIIATMASIAAPRYASSMQAHCAELAARRIVEDFRQARSRARAASASCELAFDLDADSYTIAGAASLSHASQQYAVELSEPPYEAKITAVDFSGRSEAVFDGFGRPEAPGSVTVRAGRHKRRIELDAAGQTSVHVAD